MSVRGVTGRITGGHSPGLWQSRGLIRSFTRSLTSSGTCAEAKRQRPSLSREIRDQEIFKALYRWPDPWAAPRKMSPASTAAREEDREKVMGDAAGKNEAVVPMRERSNLDLLQAIQSTESLVQFFDIERLDVDLFRSKQLWKPYGSRGIYGGHIIAQATLAACRTVEGNLLLHSLHSYFILAGDVDHATIYSVERVRDGRSYATRTVKAIQKGRAIFTVTCSFARTEVDQPSHQVPIFAEGDALNSASALPHPTALPQPETLKNQGDRVAEFMERMQKIQKDSGAGAIPKAYIDLMTTLAEERRFDPVDTRSCDENDELEMMGQQDERQMHWWKTRYPVPEDDALRKCILAYASDRHLTPTTGRAHGLSYAGYPRLSMMASLDHAMWFHEPVDPSDWLLYVMEAVKSGGGRGLGIGRIFKPDGTLVCTVCQEGLIRIDMSKKSPLPKL